MRAFALLAAVLSGIVLSPDVARAEGTWCARYGTGLEGSNCGFYSFEQCQAALSGNGGRCSPNLFPATGRETSRRTQRR